MMQLIYKVNASFEHDALSDEHCDIRWIEKDQLEVIEKEALLNPTYKKILNNILSV
ncbi:MAG TPA: hypothetical protein VFF04_00995 [Candidatus Babeliales bacterium]|nr:hypothetical protein [Candidatus Babeliales bacterium]